MYFTLVRTEKKVLFFDGLFVNKDSTVCKKNVAKGEKGHGGRGIREGIWASERKYPVFVCLWKGFVFVTTRGAMALFFLLFSAEGHGAQGTGYEVMALRYQQL